MQDQIPLNSGKYIWFDGKIIETKNALISMLNHSLHYAASVFEGEMCYNGKIFKLEEHVNRLFNSAKSLKLKIKYTPDEVIEAHHLLIKYNQLTNAYIRPLVWCSSESLKIFSPELRMHIMIASVNIKPKMQPLKMLNIMLSKWIKPNSMMIPSQVKTSASYAMLSLAKQEALEQGFDDALLLDYQGYIAECTTTNIFFVHENTIFTPTPDSSLNGITRQTIIALSAKLGFKVIETKITSQDIKNYDECFITGTAAEVQLVQSIYVSENNKIIFKKDNVGRLIQNEYISLVNS